MRSLNTFDVTLYNYLSFSSFIVDVDVDVDVDVLVGGVETRLPRICSAGTTVVKTMIGQPADDKFVSQQGSRGPKHDGKTSNKPKVPTSSPFHPTRHFENKNTNHTRVGASSTTYLFLYTTKVLFILQARAGQPAWFARN